MIIIISTWLPLAPTPTPFQLLSFNPFWGLSSTPDSRSNLECGLGAFQESQASFFDLTAQHGSWVRASLDWVPTCPCACVLLPA